MERWSQAVTNGSNALDLEKGVFTWNDPHKIARSLKHSSEQSKRRKGTVRQSAVSMITFYINRAGKNLPASRKEILERAKEELRELLK